MKDKAPLVLMEQTVMVLIFALAAAVCVRAFVLSDNISKTNAARDTAVLRAESAAEIYKNCRGIGTTAVARYGGSVKDGVWTVYWNDAWKQVKTADDAAYRLRIQPQTSEYPRMESAEVKLASLGKSGKQLVSFPLAWQEADGDE